MTWLRILFHDLVAQPLRRVTGREQLGLLPAFDRRLPSRTAAYHK